MKQLIILLTFLTVVNGGVAAERSLAWPRFRGPNGTGVAEGQKSPVAFGPVKNVKWKVPVPSGMSSPIVAGDNLVITAFDEGTLYTIAYDRATGKEAWRANAEANQIEPYFEMGGSPAASTPATDGKRIVSYFGSCGLICYDLSGEELWRFEMPPVKTAGNFGSGVSPILTDGLVVLVRDELTSPEIVAVNLAAGKRQWETKRQSTVSYCTPIVWETPEGKQLVSGGQGRMLGYDLESGAEQWFVAGMPSGCCSSPVVVDGTLYFAGWSPTAEDAQREPYDELLKKLDKDANGSLSRAEANESFHGFFDQQDTNSDGQLTHEEYESLVKHMSEGENSAFALKAGGEGNVTDSHVLWKQTEGLPCIPSAILYRGQYMIIKDGGIVTALDARTGEQISMKRPAASGTYYASPVAANGHINFTSLDDGAVTVLKAGTDKPEVIVENPSLGEQVAATPAMADDTIYIRTDKHLYAFWEAR